MDVEGIMWTTESNGLVGSTGGSLNVIGCDVTDVSVGVGNVGSRAIIGVLGVNFSDMRRSLMFLLLI